VVSSVEVVKGRQLQFTFMILFIKAFWNILKV